jgi:hypothetical protein
LYPRFNHQPNAGKANDSRNDEQPWVKVRAVAKTKRAEDKKRAPRVSPR